MTTRVLVADSLSIFRAGVRNLLLRERFDVVEAATADEALLAAETTRPEIALVDLNLPPTGGVAAVHRLAGTSTRAILWSFEPTMEVVLGGVRAGAAGFLRKDISPRALVQTLRGVVQGEAALSPDLASLLIDALHGLEDTRRARERLAQLSARELEVLGHVAGGARNRQIATSLTISEFTVKRHVQNILEKLDVSSRRDAAAYYSAAFGAAGPAHAVTQPA